ncbi:MAG: hypothetical protein U0324_20460 [Polyangiales bacterium]
MTPRALALPSAAALACCAACSVLTPFAEYRLARDAGDAAADVAPDAPEVGPVVTDVAPADAEPAPDGALDVSLDAAPDTTPDVAFDAAPDVAPDDAPDAAPDVAFDAALDVAPVPDAAPDAGPLDVPAVDLPTPCPAGQQRCDGACVDLASSVAHCGVCGARCAPPDATAGCFAGRCVITACPGSRADCNGLVDDGCEADLRGGADHCGACNNACALANATAECRAGICSLAACAPGFGDCDRNPANGCEVDLRASDAHCGACNNACARPAATSSCVDGRCTVPACVVGRGDCDRAPDNGCEVDLLQSLANCGACGNACRAGMVCAGGRCQSCPAGLADCDGDNTCETRLDQPANCGRCGNACATPNATPFCLAGECRVAACNAGFADCDTNPANGCEVNVLTSPSHCGRCGNACAAPNATAVCASGLCRVAACAAGRADCDGAFVNGCETSVLNNPAHCGACNNRCPSGFCRGTECVSFGGLLSTADHPSCTAINAPNPYTGTYTCAPGTSPAVVRRIIDCPAGAFTGATTYLCGTPGTVTAYAGAYQVVNCAGTSVCVPNPYTGGCTCPAGSAPTSPINLYADAPGCGGLHAAQMVFCVRAPATAGFGGAWHRRDDGACLVPNPLAAGCACPAGFGAIGLRAITPPPTVYGSTIAICLR